MGLPERYLSDVLGQEIFNADMDSNKNTSGLKL